MFSEQETKCLTVQTNQLPIDAYFSEIVYQKEMEQIFNSMPRYVGHEQMVPNIGDYCSIETEGHGRVLVRNADEITLLSNVCRHRQSIVLRGKGNSANITCPLHRWTYNLKGVLIGAPLFNETPCKHLENFSLQRWNGLLFEDGPHSINNHLRSLPKEIFELIDFRKYTLDRTEIFECQYNWKTFIEFYLEDYHVEPYHPGLGNFVSCDDIKWQFGKWHSLQTVGIKNNLQMPGQSEIYRSWHNAVRDYCRGRLPKYGAVWLYIYPNVMIEWYPLVLVISTLIPRGPTQVTNQVEFYHPEEIMLFDQEFIDGARSAASAYCETAIEDNEIGENMQAGRKALWQRGTCETGPYQHPLEDGMEHFHILYREQLRHSFPSSI